LVIDKKIITRFYKLTQVFMRSDFGHGMWNIYATYADDALFTFSGASGVFKCLIWHCCPFNWHSWSAESNLKSGDLTELPASRGAVGT
jgi:hypothetical protein